MSMSSRARRMLQHQIRNKADAELNLIPMIDILSVMVSFLLVYSTEVEVVQNSKSIDIPQSISQQRPRQTAPPPGNTRLRPMHTGRFVVRCRRAVGTLTCR